ncbi:MAG: hypothetical protein RIQ93_2427, partial [Verrucomicrobiota bacterium]
MIRVAAARGLSKKQGRRGGANNDWGFFWLLRPDGDTDGTAAQKLPLFFPAASPATNGGTWQYFRLMRKIPALLLAPLLVLIVQALGAPAPVTAPVEGLRDATPRAHALVGGRIVVAPGKVIERGTLVIRDGVIVAVGAEVATPPDARIWDVAGRTLYAGFIETHSAAFLPAAWKPLPSRPVAGPPAAGAAAPADVGARSWNARVTPERSGARALVPELKAAEGLRALGFTAAHLVPARGIFRGQTALVSLGENVTNAAVIRAEVSQHAAFERNAERRGYPNSLMGAVALVRQTLLDAQWYAAAHTAFARGASGVERPEVNASLAALGPVTRGEQALWFTLQDELDVERALGLQREFGLRLTLVGNGAEYRALAALAAARVPVITPLAFPETPVIDTPGQALDVPLHELQHWDLARTNPGVLANAGVRVALTSAGLKRPADFWPNLRKAVAAGLTADAALAGLTTVPAELLGAAQLGTLEVG